MVERIQSVNSLEPKQINRITNNNLMKSVHKYLQMNVNNYKHFLKHYHNDTNFILDKHFIFY